MGSLDDETPIVPDGLTIRRRRRRMGISRRDFVSLVERRAVEATGVAESISRNVLQGIEDTNERVPYATLCLIALGLDCNPVELLAPERPRRTGDRAGR